MSASVMPMDDFRNKNDGGLVGRAGGGGGSSFNVNWYATKKTVAQGLLDIALLTANAAQLKQVLLSDGEHQFYHSMLVLISLSIVLQVLAGVLQLVLVTLNVNNAQHHRCADVVNNVVTGLVFSITIVNVIISAFGIEDGGGPRALPSHTAAANKEPLKA